MPIGKLRRLLRLPAAERWLLVKVAALLVAARLGLRLLPFERARRLSDGLVRAPIRVRKEERDPRKIVRAVETAGRHLPWAGTCLTVALVSQVMLRRREHPALVRIGIAGGGGSALEAHAWVESGDEVVIGGGGIEKYTVLTTL